MWSRDKAAVEHAWYICGVDLCMLCLPSHLLTTRKMLSSGGASLRSCIDIRRGKGTGNVHILYAVKFISCSVWFNSVVAIGIFNTFYRSFFELIMACI